MRVASRAVLGVFALSACALFLISTSTHSQPDALGLGVAGGALTQTGVRGRSMQTHAKKPSRRFRAIMEKVEKKPYKAMEAISLLKEVASAKFRETYELHANLNIDPRKATQNLRTTVVLPKGTGKEVSVAVLCKDEDAKEMKAAGADVAGFQDLIDDIGKGELNFDRLITTPDLMPQIARLGRVLGPKGLMPSIKSGTVTTDPSATIKEIKGGRLELRADRKGVVHIPFGKVDFSEEDLLENLKAIQDAIEANKPSDIKKVYWKSAYLTTSMGPGLQLDLSAFNMKDYA
eukprot:CAMPEP_0197524538 /NCGR_PEP_ID=MMETSP1318-20131121/9185_1 /TAXON_ID=552666 /ORGANISM="Partenskyella glossopodia, Strain RCC365" /LENGTH=289 /DNA_ID=CAMNT_0043077513 /DNA_START=42 /DNA_END=911 /DNA_ORIENTATION=+